MAIVQLVLRQNLGGANQITHHQLCDLLMVCVIKGKADSCVAQAAAAPVLLQPLEFQTGGCCVVTSLMPTVTSSE